jgi:hypothetical protein
LRRSRVARGPSDDRGVKSRRPMQLAHAPQLRPGLRAREHHVRCAPARRAPRHLGADGARGDDGHRCPRWLRDWRGVESPPGGVGTLGSGSLADSLLGPRVRLVFVAAQVASLKQEAQVSSVSLPDQGRCSLLCLGGPMNQDGERDLRRAELALDGLESRSAPRGLSIRMVKRPPRGVRTQSDGALSAALTGSVTD